MFISIKLSERYFELCIPLSTLKRAIFVHLKYYISNCQRNQMQLMRQHVQYVLNPHVCYVITFFFIFYSLVFLSSFPMSTLRPFDERLFEVYKKINQPNTLPTAAREVTVVAALSHHSSIVHLQQIAGVQFRPSIVVDVKATQIFLGLLHS